MSIDNLNTADYKFLREMLDREVGILLEDGKEYLAVTRLEPILRQHNLPDLGVLVERLRKHDRPLKSDVIDAMTVNETLFFRDPNVWRSLRENLLPELIEANSAKRTMRMWSAACSSGQEPYSLAIVLAELLGKEDASWDVKISASDLSREMVARTKAGVFSNYEVSRGMEAETRDRYFRPLGDKWQVNDRLRSRVDTRQANLSSLPPALGPFDLIMLRNVLIYFSAETREDVLRQMAKLLTPTGCLLLGASEGAVGVPSVLTPVRMNGLVAFKLSGAKDSILSEASRKPRTTSSAFERTSPSPRGTPGSSGPESATSDRPSRARRSTDPLPGEDSAKRVTARRSGEDSFRRSSKTPVRSTPASDASRSESRERPTVGASIGSVRTESTSNTRTESTPGNGEPSALERLRALRDERDRRGR